MSLRKEPNDRIWIIPFIAGLLVVIAILTPTAVFFSGGVFWVWWMWDFTWMGVFGYEPVFIFISDLDIIILSIITTITLILSAINLFILSHTTRTRDIKLNKFYLQSVLGPFLTMGIIIYYCIAMGRAFFDGVTLTHTSVSPGIPFWLGFSPSFGVILPFISSIFSFIAAGVVGNREATIKYKMDITTGYIPYSRRIGNQNFCTKCGKKIPHTGVKFCTNCGIKFQDHV